MEARESGVQYGCSERSDGQKAGVETLSGNVGRECQAEEFGLCPEDSVESSAESEGEPGFGWVTLWCEGHSETGRR